VYDDAPGLVLGLTVARAGQACGDRPCWARVSTDSYRYADPVASADGVERIVLRGGAAGRGRIVLKAGNDAPRGQVAFPGGAAASLEGANAVTVQLVASDGVCVGGTLRDVSRADGESVRAKATSGP
jgi:hypothetical protein